MLSHRMCMKMSSNTLGTRNVRSAADETMKTMRFYIKNHTDSTLPLHDSSTLRPTYLQSKGSCPQFFRTPLGFPKRLSDKECFAPCK